MFNVKDWNIEEITGYKPISTFYMDFGIAEKFGLAAVKDTFKNCMAGWKTSYKMLTELVMVLNWKSWEHADEYGIAQSPLCKLYIQLYNEAADYATKHLKGEQLDYYFETTD